MKPRTWHPANIFPTPEIKLLVRTVDGKQLAAIRPTYAKSYSADPDFRELSDQTIPINEVTEWSIL